MKSILEELWYGNIYPILDFFDRYHSSRALHPSVDSSLSR